MEHAAEYRRFRAPPQDGQTLVDPPRAALADVVERNRRQLAAVRCDVQGRELTELAASARRALIEQAVAYTSQYADVTSPPTSANDPVVLSGHQPQLFHPGVWYKNFLLGRLARDTGGVGIHLLVDSDLCRTASIRVPTGNVDRPRVEMVEYDRLDAAMPYEERLVRDETVFASFPARVVAALNGLVRHPLVESFWPQTQGTDGAPCPLGHRLARARHSQERAWGNHTLELPQSAVCSLPDFAWFAAHVLAHLPRFWSAHNESLADYRRTHRLRNRAQPVPDLAESDGWLEAPFWIWSAGDPRRRPLFARQRGDLLHVTDRNDQSFTLTLAADGDAAAAVDQLVALSRGGVKIRTRALATTLFARLVLGDLFIHGIGGAKYDQVTDQIARRFFAFQPPQFATVSATLRLPIEHTSVAPRQQQRLRQQLREVHYHPEIFLPRVPMTNDEVSNALESVQQKRRWINTPQTPHNARQRHEAIVAANERLQPYLAPLRRELESHRAAADERTRSNTILESREYSFCLFPRAQLQILLLDGQPQSS